MVVLPQLRSNEFKNTEEKKFSAKIYLNRNVMRIYNTKTQKFFTI